ncbi:hypothetical protein D3C84_573380 [compost metagenome]
MNHVDHELLVEITADQACTGFADGSMLVGAEVAEFAVGVGSGLLDHGQGHDQLRVVRDRNTGEAEVVYRPQGLDAVVRFSGNFESAKQVFFDAQ